MRRTQRDDAYRGTGYLFQFLAAFIVSCFSIHDVYDITLNLYCHVTFVKAAGHLRTGLTGFT
jgi:hypothetical protein